MLLKWLARKVSDRLDDAWTSDLEAQAARISRMQGQIGNMNSRVLELESEVQQLLEAKQDG